jgi:hypothetical protein
MDSSGLGQGPAECSCEHGSDTSVSTECWNIVEWSRNWLLLREVSATRSANWLRWTFRTRNEVRADSWAYQDEWLRRGEKDQNWSGALWHIQPVLGNYREINIWQTLLSNSFIDKCVYRKERIQKLRTVFSVRSVPRRVSEYSLLRQFGVQLL